MRPMSSYLRVSTKYVFLDLNVIFGYNVGEHVGHTKEIGLFDLC